MMWAVTLTLGLIVIAIGATVGSFINVCIYRIPWQKSVIWPASHCPRCLEAIEPRDNVPMLSRLLLGGVCRRCGLPISIRYSLVELLTTCLFVLMYCVDVVIPNLDRYGSVPVDDLIRLAYDATLIAFLIVATFIDYDLTVIPDQITIPGMVIGIVAGVWLPTIRSAPSHAITHADGFWFGMIGLLTGGGMTLAVRTLGSLALRKEAMGFGDVTLMAMIGSFVGWQFSILTFFLGAFLGLFHAIGKIFILIGKRWSGIQSRGSDHELAFGPYLSMAAILLLLCRKPLWIGWGDELFRTLSVVFWYLLGMDS